MQEPDPAGLESFEEFYVNHRVDVYRALAVTLCDPQLAREAADEAMTRVYMHWSRVSFYENPAGWAYRVGLNWATSWWRKVHREQPVGEVAGSHEPEPAPAGGDFHAYAMLTNLPRAQRAVVVCRVLLQLSTAETAAALDTTEGTVKSRLARALATLRTSLDRDDSMVTR
ncbi:RNA polymerase sigma factor [Dactylosporangium aurantiacum]|uniref:RNA polymerase sigma factor n=1 Tax=Dactylosporangium aurantiacum TaxID=35754 RepID=A0A9Q9IRK2_9ACTN|nr:sigma factor-like helix-turn-helix DNA-binding protein [Dactylosporangium aurantiacum]MDG6109888.1 sigma factor-like helix-turn-helix DNA-binding protein [Dactylosporangium aurantiacum]UWZ58114.1 RNA polymerase sigma factor [Dactylosporangium aurantiacum]